MTAISIRRDFQTTNRDELLATVTWNALVEPGDRIAGELINELGPCGALVAFKQRRELGEDVRAAYERWSPRFSENLATDKIACANRYDFKLLLPSDEMWPHQFRDLGPHSPLAIWYRGNIEHLVGLSRPIGVVGSRNATHYGQRVTSELVACLVQDGAVTVSGGALGIDTVAHRTALKLEGSTIAFMAGALDSLYPSANLELFDEISHKGLLLSEMSPGAKPTRWRFLQRNRLIAALSEAVVVTEAGWRSGSINTVNHATELGRPVFAVPGPITSAASAGCNRLIRDSKANLLIEVSDLPVELGWRSSGQTELEGLGVLELRALDALERRGRSFDDLLKATGMALVELKMALGTLKLLGKVDLTTDGLWKRSHSRLLK
ncbi:MAG: DNA-protecting protein DprA [Actinomycetota bacterium]